MKKIDLYNGDVELVFNEGKHVYTWNGKFIPGVTTVLKRLDKPALIQWAANMASSYVLENLPPDASKEQLELVCKEAKTAHRRFASQAADIGTEVHKLAEDIISGRPYETPSSEQAQKGADAFLEWYRSRSINPFALEQMVFSKRWYYAGTVDFFGEINQELCVLDFKTSSGLYPEMILQLCAYAIAIEEEQGMDTRINTGYIVRLDKKTGKFAAYRINLADLYRDTWLRLKETDDLMKKLEGNIDGIRKQATAKRAA
jgi:hypothetical protein